MSDRRTAPLTPSLIPGEALRDCEVAVIEGKDRGLSRRLDLGRLTIGADPRCDLVLTDPTVSSVHAEMAPLPTGIRVRDLESTNGITFLGNRVVDLIIQPGSVIGLGQTQLAVLPRHRQELEPVQTSQYGQMIGHSPAMRRVFAMLKRLEGSAVTVLFLGETGCGKSLAARTLHDFSGRSGPFVSVDCGAISPELLQSELFGHLKGSFSGAEANRVGAVESAAEGTLFLDEIGNLPLHVQPVLLRFLETREIQPVGADRHHTVDTRIIAASNQDLSRCVEQGTFRPDLFYRLSVISIPIPPLRQCPEDILPMVGSFIEQEGRDTESLPPDLVATFRSYTWPGNRRQLRNAVQRFLTTGHIWGEALTSPDSAEGEADFHTAKSRLVERFEQTYLLELIKQHGGNLSAASRASGLVRHHLRTLLRKHGIDPETFRKG